MNITNRKRKREERQRAKDQRRRFRQEAEWKRQHPRRSLLSSEEALRAEVAKIEAKNRRRSENAGVLGMVAAILAVTSARHAGEP